MMRFAGRWAACVLVAVMCLPAGAKTHRKGHHRVKPLKVQIAKLLADPAVSAAHWGILVTEMDGSRARADLCAERGAAVSAGEQCEVVYDGGGDGFAGAGDDV